MRRITKVRRHPGGEILFRAAACTGALYHVEVYLACGDLEGLPAGLYHFAPHDFALRRLRPGDWRLVLVEATGNEPSAAAAPVILILTSTFWRLSRAEPLFGGRANLAHQPRSTARRPAPFRLGSWRRRPCRTGGAIRGCGVPAAVRSRPHLGVLSYFA